MRSIDVMLSRPGLYVVVAHGTVGLVEVDPDGRCFSMCVDPPYEREEELKAGGWCVGNILGILGPFQQRSEAR